MRAFLLASAFLFSQSSFAELVSEASNAEGLRNVLHWEKTSTPVTFEYLEKKAFKGACFGADGPLSEPVIYLTTGSRLKDQNLGPALMKIENKVLMGGISPKQRTHTTAEVRSVLGDHDEIWNNVINSISVKSEPAVWETDMVRGEIRLNGPYLVVVLRANADYYDKYSTAKNPKPIVKKNAPVSACYFYEELK